MASLMSSSADALRGQVSWIRQFPKRMFSESVVGAPIQAPAHVEAIDFDKDGDLDLVVASLGVLNPSNNRVGSVVILENDGSSDSSITPLPPTLREWRT